MNYTFAAGWFLGVLIRTLAPYLIKVLDGSVKFDIKYLRSAIASLCMGMLTGAIILPQSNLVMVGVTETLLAGMTAGFTAQSLSQYIIKAGE